MSLPFSIKEFLDTFEKYNLSTWPLQLLFYLMALCIIYLSWVKHKASDKAISLMLSFFWIWMGAIYHLAYFTVINKAAVAFGLAFIVQGILFFYHGVVKNSVPIHFMKNIYGIAGSILILFALVIYPILNYLHGHIYPASPSFGLPCPTTIFTFGVLLWADKKIPRILLIVPLIWSVVGFAAAYLLGMKEDIGLVAAAVVFVFLHSFRARLLPVPH